MNRSRLLTACLVIFAGCDGESGTSTDVSRATAVRPAATQPKAPVSVVTDADLEREVIRIVAGQMGVKPSEVKRATHLKRDLKADELDTVELVMALEDGFQISIPDEDAEKLQTVGELIDYVRASRKK